MKTIVNNLRPLLLGTLIAFTFNSQADIPAGGNEKPNMNRHTSSMGESDRYTKLDSHGNRLENSATAWACVRDNQTGLVWEVSNNDGANEAYTWDETSQLAQRVNEHGLCGATDWRLPSKDELLTIVDQQNESLKINTTYFPDTQSGFYWSSTPYDSHENGAWLVYFSLGSAFAGNKQIDYYARVVRNDF